MDENDYGTDLEALTLRVFGGPGEYASPAELEDFVRDATDIWHKWPAAHRDELRAYLARLACSLLGPRECDDSCFAFVDQRVIPAA